MSDLLPLFPLPNVVLFPNVFLPLHIFEPRYREMVADALAGDRMIGMVLLRPGWETRLRGPAAGLPDRLQRRDHATSSGCPTAATTSCCAASNGSGSSRKTTLAATAARMVEPLRRAPLGGDRPRRPAACSGRSSKSLLAPTPVEHAGADPRMTGVGDDRRGSGQRAGAVPRSRAARKAGAARAATPAQPRRVAGRAARDEDADGAHARPVNVAH